MGRSFRLGKIFGIPLYLHYTWFLLFIYITVAICVWVLKDCPLRIRVAVGVGTSLLFFASIMAHELSHSFVARRNGIPVRSITLFFFGGVAHISREATRPRTELIMAIAGPLCSMILAGIFFLIWYSLWGTVEEFTINPIWWLASINLILALFNLIPGFPLDGGRVLRALLWRGMGNYIRATRIASLIGRGFGYFMIVAGLALMLTSPFTKTINPVQGLMLAFIGWFLEGAAATSYRQVEFREGLRDLTAQEVMSTEYAVVPPNLSLKELAQGYILPTGRQYFVVATEGQIKGIVSFSIIKAVPQPQWEITTVSAVMTPMDRLVSVSPRENALALLERMQEYNISQVLVIREGVVIGIITQDNLLRFLRLRAELGMRR